VLVRRLEALGGISCIFLTHKDDVGDHEKWAAHFKAPRIMHSSEVRGSTQGVEVKLEGEGPWDLQGQALAAGGTESSEAASQLVFTPGHTKGHVCLYYAPEKSLLSGEAVNGAAV
jgi:glyoxylase-like metal-dependent hydrolase (beta-lactamase superfamily II)